MHLFDEQKTRIDENKDSEKEGLKFTQNDYNQTEIDATAGIRHIVRFVTFSFFLNIYIYISQT